MVEYLSWILWGDDVAYNLFVLWFVLVCIILIGVEAECLAIEQLHIMNIKSIFVVSPKMMWIIRKSRELVKFEEEVWNMKQVNIGQTCVSMFAFEDGVEFHGT